jgi:hypothetical protein
MVPQPADDRLARAKRVANMARTDDVAAILRTSEILDRCDVCQKSSAADPHRARRAGIG